MRCEIWEKKNNTNKDLFVLESIQEEKTSKEDVGSAYSIKRESVIFGIREENSINQKKKLILSLSSIMQLTNLGEKKEAIY